MLNAVLNQSAFFLNTSKYRKWGKSLIMGDVNRVFCRFSVNISQGSEIVEIFFTKDGN